MNCKQFDEIITNKISQIDNYYLVADNYELALLGTHKHILMCMKNKGYDWIMKNKTKINDCNTNYMNYNKLTWTELLKKILNIELL